MSEQDNDEVGQTSIKLGPGDLLQAARIEQGITLEDIARQMNLNAKILQSIEDDDYSDIQSPIFIRGYLRTYSRLVGIDENETIRLFGEFYQADDPAIQSIGNTAPEISSNDFRVKWMTYAVIIGLIALLSVWWVNNYKVDGVVETLAEEASPIEQIEEQVVVEKQIQEQLPSMEMPTNEKTADVDVIDQAIEEETLTVELVDEPDAIIEVSDDVTEEPLVAKITTVKNVQEKKAAVGTDVLELSIVATSWGNIKDASGQQLIQDLLNTGETYRLVGQKPFKIFLGNGYGVEIVLNGEEIDFSKHVRSSNNTARFELGQ